MTLNNCHNNISFLYTVYKIDWVLTIFLWTKLCGVAILNWDDRKHEQFVDIHPKMIFWEFHWCILLMLQMNTQTRQKNYNLLPLAGGGYLHSCRGIIEKQNKLIKTSCLPERHSKWPGLHAYEFVNKFSEFRLWSEQVSSSVYTYVPVQTLELSSGCFFMVCKNEWTSPYSTCSHRNKRMMKASCAC